MTTILQYYEHGLLLQDIFTEWTFYMEYGEPVGQVDALRMTEDGENLLKSSVPAIKAWAEWLADELRQNNEIHDGAAQDAGYTYETRGGTDPDAHWRAA